MSYEREDLYRRASDLFLQVCEVELPERRNRMEIACRDDAALLAEVRSLLDAHDRLTNFLAHPVSPEPALPTAPTAAPRQIGPCRILGVLGRGGMGVVYLAEQDHPRRQVALKVLQPGLAGPEHQRRFEHEAEILGRLQHPGIAQIFEAGSEQSPDGAQPWFAMELVRGDSLIEYADGHRLPLRERLQLFTRICAAVQHAHQHGVVHRDLKPANILVEDSGQPKILDFGIARAAETDARTSSALTARGELLGTLPYMSPEQIGGDPSQIDARTDVYALGVIAYQLACGKLPHDTTGRSLVEMARAIRETDPIALGAQRRELSGDVETIVAKALEKDAARRYASAIELAADVERFLQHEPVLARPPSTAYQLAKFARRNRILVVGVAATFAALVFGIAGTSWQSVRASEQAQLAKSNEAAAKRKEADARSSERRARKVTELVQKALVESDPNQAGSQSLTVAAAMDNAIREIDAGALKDDPETEASLQVTIARILDGNSRSEDALRLAREALDTRQRLFHGDNPDVAAGLDCVASCLESVGRSAEALPNYMAALNMRQRLFPGDHPDVASSLGNLAFCLMSLGQLVEALPKCEAALEMRQRLFPGDQALVAVGLNNVAGCLMSLGRSADALAKFEAALEMKRRLFPGDHPSIAASLNNIAGCLMSLGRSADALVKFEAAFEMHQRVFAGDHPVVATDLNNIGNCLESLGRSAEALPKFMVALEMQQRLVPGDHPTAAIVLDNIALCLQSLGRSAEALPKFEAALEMQHRLFSGDHPDVAKSLSNVGYCLQALGRSAEALSEFEAALDMQQRLYPGDHPDVAMSLGNIGACLLALLRFEEALPKYEAALEMNQRLFPGDHPEVAKSLRSFAVCLHSLDMGAEALPLAQQAAEMGGRVFPEGHLSRVGFAETLAMIRESLAR